MSVSPAIPSIDAWTRARERYVEDLSEEEREIYSKASTERIFYDASAAEKTHKANSSSRRFATQKLKPLVDAIEEYGKALDVYANAYALVLCPLWGSIRVVLHVWLFFLLRVVCPDLCPQYRGQPQSTGDGLRYQACTWDEIFFVFFSSGQC